MRAHKHKALIIFLTLLAGLAWILWTVNEPGSAPQGSRRRPPAPRTELPGKPSDGAGPTVAAPSVSEEASQVIEEALPALLRGRVLGNGRGLPKAQVFLVPMHLTVGLMSGVTRTLATVSGEPRGLERQVADLRESVIRARQRAQVAETDAAGVYSFHDIESGNYLVMTVASGWVFRYGDAVSLVEGETQELDQRLDEGVAISGYVVNSTGAGVSGVTVRAESRVGDGSVTRRAFKKLLDHVNGTLLRGPFEDRSSVDGAFSIDSLAPDVYDLDAVGADGVRTRLESVASGRSDVILYMPASAQVSGFLVDDAGIPVGDVVLELASRSDPNQPAALTDLKVFIEAVERVFGVDPLTSTTDSRGRFFFERVSPGGYELSVNGRRFSSLRRQLQIDEDEGLDLGMVRAARDAHVPVHLESDLLVDGVVVDEESGEPISGADVDGGEVVTTTASDGRFSLDGVVAREFTLRAAANGYVGRDFRVEVEPARRELELRLQRVPWISGTVRDPEGEAVANCIVRLIPAGDDVIPWRKIDPRFRALDLAVTDGRGRYRIKNLRRLDAEETYKLLAEHPGYAHGEAGAVEISDADEREIEIDLRLGLPGAVDGVVTDSDAPMSDAIVRMRVASDGENALSEVFSPWGNLGGDVAVVRTDADGKFSVDSLARGAYLVEAELPGFRTSLSYEVTVEAGESSHVEIEIDSGGEIRGVVTDARGANLAGARVRLLREFGPADDPMRIAQQLLGSSFKATTTDANGAFSFVGLPEGAYTVKASAEGFASGKVTGVASGADQVSLVLDASGTLEGQVIDRESGNAVTSFILALGPVHDHERRVGDERRVRRRVRDSEGRYRRDDLPAGEYRVAVSAKGYASASRLVTVRRGDVALWDVALVRAGSVQGQVVDAETGSPVGGARVHLVSTGDDLSPRVEVSTRTFQDGTYLFENVGPGIVRFRVKHAAYIPAAEVVLELGTGEALEYGFRLRRGLTLAGRVFESSSGLAMQQTLISVQGNFPENRTVRKSDVTSVEGQFHFSGLEPGTYNLYLPLKGAHTSFEIDLQEDRYNDRIDFPTSNDR